MIVVVELGGEDHRLGVERQVVRHDVGGREHRIRRQHRQLAVGGRRAQRHQAAARHVAGVVEHVPGVGARQALQEHDRRDVGGERPRRAVVIRASAGGDSRRQKPDLRCGPKLLPSVGLLLGAMSQQDRGHARSATRRRAGRGYPTPRGARRIGGAPRRVGDVGAIGARPMRCCATGCATSMCSRLPSDGQREYDDLRWRSSLSFFPKASASASTS